MLLKIMSIIFVLWVSSAIIRLFYVMSNDGVRFTLLTPIRFLYRRWCILHHGTITAKESTRFC